MKRSTPAKRRRGSVDKATDLRAPQKPLTASRPELQGAPDRVVAKIDAKRKTGGLGASLRAGALTRRMRHTAGFSQSELAKLIGVSQARVSEIEAGAGKQGPTWELMERIASACNVRLGIVPVAREYPNHADSSLVSGPAGALDEGVAMEVSQVDETFGAAIGINEPFSVQEGLMSGYRAMPKRVMTGTVVSDKIDKTVKVLVEKRVKHPLYGKIIKRSKTYLAHAEGNEYRQGETVRIVESAPSAKLKTWRVLSRVDTHAASERGEKKPAKVKKNEVSAETVDTVLTLHGHVRILHDFPVSAESMIRTRIPDEPSDE